MANDLSMVLSSDQEELPRQIVAPAWTKIVSKASDIVRNQKANIKGTTTSPPVLQLPKDKMTVNSTIATENGLFYKDVQIGDIDQSLVEWDSMPPYALLSHRLAGALREAKRDSLDLCEVLVPCDLINRISKDIVRMSDHEPCGLRGCLVVINLEEKTSVARKIGKLKVDSETVATFELHLTLKKENSNWLNLRQLVPSRLLKKIGRAPTLIVSEAYTLNKKKLYRSSSRE